ncbi:MAG: hypothetical protein AAFO94_07720 [Bacteroidota bacterium]
MRLLFFCFFLSVNVLAWGQHRQTAFNSNDYSAVVSDDLPVFEVPDSIFSEETAHELISQYGEWVTFNRYNNLETYQVWYGEGKKIRINAGLFMIAQCVWQLDKRERILFAVKGYDQGTRNGRRKKIYKAMKRLGIPWTAMTVGSFRAPEELRVDWLFENEYVAIGIEY